MSSPIHINSDARGWTHEGSRAKNEGKVLAFHETLPDYNKTPLHSLPDVARELGLGHVLVKDESNRFGLPAFKILGASWAMYRAVGWHLGIPVAEGQISIAELGAKARKAAVEIVTATEGNCGRAIARMGKYMGIPVRVWVPSFMPEATRELIRGEGAEVTVIDGSYDDLIPIISEEAEDKDTILILDVSFEGFTDVPKYFVQGYGTMLAEADKQILQATGEKAATHAVVPCGAGSVAEAVTAHYKAPGRESRAAILSVEPTGAACLQASLKAGQSVTVQTQDTIMNGLNCGTLSTTAWPVLKAGIDVSVVISDLESHAAVKDLTANRISAGPCGGATLAALKKVCSDADTKGYLGLDGSSIVVLYCTEGSREYPVPT
ncbi:pyridoxal-phosphate dependent enzyme family protein [Xylaria bambusicola]|uniref:pyridoxal-phosphate dependent enzyme family protein n=1 Tax=Xylaria bambusicola TaxID=326684 RepID=UPI0020079A6D|nr:pyridoxal-phosphate dependent enzyme family protein [Xylaria bambusicola]KAI0517774.1 pyridoxal-phosphate dependent enzyme family protein [Xylaria bambusicola]